MQEVKGSVYTALIPSFGHAGGKKDDSRPLAAGCAASDSHRTSSLASVRSERYNTCRRQPGTWNRRQQAQGAFNAPRKRRYAPAANARAGSPKFSGLKSIAGAQEGALLCTAYLDHLLSTPRPHENFFAGSRTS